MATVKKSKPAAKSKPAPKKPVAKTTKPAKPVAKAVVKPVAKKPVVALKLPRPSLAAQFTPISATGKLPPRLQAVVDHHEISTVLTNICRGIDRGDDNLLRSAFHPDATLDLGPGVFQGTVGDYMGWIGAVMAQVKSSHHLISNTRVELQSDAAFVETYFVAHHRLDKPTGREDLFIAGRYLDRFDRRPAGAGVWKIVHRKQVLDWVRTEPVADIFYHLNPDTLWGQRSKADMSSHMEQFPAGQQGGKMPSFVGRRYEGKSIKL